MLPIHFPISRYKSYYKDCRHALTNSSRNLPTLKIFQHVCDSLFGIPVRPKYILEITQYTMPHKDIYKLNLPEILIYWLNEIERSTLIKPSPSVDVQLYLDIEEMNEDYLWVYVIAIVRNFL